MTIEVELINGFSLLGVEYFDDEWYGKGLIVEFLFFRFLLQWDK